MSSHQHIFTYVKTLPCQAQADHDKVADISSCPCGASLIVKIPIREYEERMLQEVEEFEEV